MRILLDAHVSGRAIGRTLRDDGHDVRAVDSEVELEGASDDELLELAASENRVFSSQPHAYLGVLRKAQGAWEDASRCFSDAVALAREADVPAQLLYAESRLAELDVLRGRPSDAIARLEPRASDMQWLFDVLLLSILAEAYADAGDAIKAEEVVDFALTREPG